LPDVEYALYLVNLLDEIGAAQQSSMGLSPLTWQEIKAWKELTDTDITSWELLLIRHLSILYTTELSQGGSPKRKAPYTDVTVKHDWGNAFAAALRSIKNRTNTE
jgi:hypothetical protein